MDISEIIAILTAEAKALGLTDYDILYEQNETISAEGLNHEISACSSGVSGGVGFRCIYKGKMGTASTEALSNKALTKIVADAMENAVCISSDDEPEIFGGSENYNNIAPLLEEMTAGDVKKETLSLLEDTFAQSEKVQEGTQATTEYFSCKRVLHNAKGLHLESQVSDVMACVEAVVTDKDDTQSAYTVGQGMFTDNLKALPKDAVTKALAACGGDLPETKEMPVVFDGAVFREFLSAFADAFSGKAVRLGMSRFAGKLEEKVASEIVTMTDNPFRENCRMQTAFDGEGVATYEKTLIEKGVLKQFLYDLSNGKKAGVTSTGNAHRSFSGNTYIAPYHLGILSGNDTEDALLKKAKNGIYITDCKGFHAGANSVTGDFSIESAGFLLENGIKTKAVKSFTVAGNFFDLLQHITALGDTIHWGCSGDFTAYGSPMVLVDKLSIAGK